MKSDDQHIRASKRQSITFQYTAMLNFSGANSGLIEDLDRLNEKATEVFKKRLKKLRKRYPKAKIRFLNDQPGTTHNISTDVLNVSNKAA